MFLDSYEKAALDLFGCKKTQELRNCPSLEHVQTCDLLEVASAFAELYLHVNDPCTDNFRILPSKNKALYKKKQDKGCCGFADSSILTSKGVRYLVGFNYGH